MMLRGSSQTSGAEVNLETIVAGTEVDSLIEGGAELVAFVEAVLLHPDSIESSRRELSDKLGEARMIDAAGVIGNFQRMVRIADSTGITLGDLDQVTADLRDELKINAFAR